MVYGVEFEIAGGLFSAGWRGFGGNGDESGEYVPPAACLCCCSCTGEAWLTVCEGVVDVVEHVVG